MSNIYIFDLDGTLVDSMPYFAKGILSIADDAGLSYDDSLLKILTPLGYTKSAEYYVNVLGVKESTESLIKKIGERLYYEYANNIITKPYVKEYLRLLSSEGARLFVLTASPHLVTDVCLQRNGVFDLFEKVWSVEDFGLSKSSPELFHKVAEVIGCDEGEINYFDDSLIALENAKKAGYITYGVYDAHSDAELARMRDGLSDVLVMNFKDVYMSKNEITVWGNNILQSFIKENKYNANAPFAILPTERFELMMKAYGYYSPDIVTLQECDEGWHDLLDSPEGLPSLGYTDATGGFIHRSIRLVRNPVYVKADRFTVEAAGYREYEGTGNGRDANPWCYSWAVLTDKLTDTRFAVTSTHFVWVSIDNWAARDRFAKELSAFISELETKYGVPVVALGDYNAHFEEPAYSTMKTDLLSARDVTPARANMEYRSTNRIGQSPALNSDGKGVVDHCFISKSGIVPKKYGLVIEPMTYAYSDHVPQSFTFEIE